jgi:hypothetical protein
MSYYVLDRIESLEDGTVISFEHGELNVGKNGNFNTWEVNVSGVENSKFFHRVIKERRKPLLQFTTETQDVFEGIVIVSDYTDGSNGFSANMTGVRELISK